jgi:hypothetical protein
VHIDPHIEGQSIVVDLSRITPDIAEEATILGQEYADKHADEVHGVDQIRLRSAAAFHLIGASQRAQGDAPPQASQAPRVISIPQPDPAAPAPIGPRTIKAASFNGGPAAPAAPAGQPTGGLLDAYSQPRPHQAAPATLTQPAPPAQAAGPPAKKVTFGVPGFGLHEAYYHDVLVDKQCFTLVYDERYKGGSRYWPQIDGPFAARVEGDPNDYELIWPDQSIHDPATCRTYVTLYIEKRVPQGEPS